MTQYLASVRAKRVLKSKSDTKVGVVVAAGEILDGHQPPGTIGGESTTDLLRQARYDNAVKAVVLRVDSPGGSMFASEQILREVQSLRKAGKPVVVSMSSYGASGGYYISAAANQIFASPTTLTGSIGVFSVVPTFQRTLEKLGIKVDGLGTTPLAGDMRLDRALTPAARQILQSSVDHAYSEFLRRVGDGRKKTGGGRGQDRAGPGVGRRRCPAHRPGRSSRRSQGRGRRGREAGATGRGLRCGLHRARTQPAGAVADAASIRDGSTGPTRRHQFRSAAASSGFSTPCSIRRAP